MVDPIKFSIEVKSNLTDSHNSTKSDSDLIIPDFSILNEGNSNKPHGCIFLQSNKFKAFWDIVIILILLIIALIVPYNLAFTESEPIVWNYIN